MDCEGDLTTGQVKNTYFKFGVTSLRQLYRSDTFLKRVYMHTHEFISMFKSHSLLEWTSLARSVRKTDLTFTTSELLL